MMLKPLLAPCFCSLLGAQAVLMPRKRRQAFVWDDAYSNKTTDSVPMWSNLGPDPYLQEFMARPQSLASADVLEVGCGEGYDLNYLLDLGHKVTCIDVSHVAIDRLSKVYANASLIQGDIADDHLLGDAKFIGRFDLVFMRSVLYHLAHPLKRAALTHIYSWLKPGGYFLDLEYDPARNSNMAAQENAQRVAESAVPVGPMFSLPTAKTQELLQSVFKMQSKETENCSWQSPILKRKVYCARFELQK